MPPRHLRPRRRTQLRYVGGVNPRRTVTQQDADRIAQARAAKDAAEANWRAVILDVTTRSSIRETAKEAGISPDTITQWKKHN